MILEWQVWTLYLTYILLLLFAQALEVSGLPWAAGSRQVLWTLRRTERTIRQRLRLTCDYMTGCVPAAHPSVGSQ